MKFTPAVAGLTSFLLSGCAHHQLREISPMAAVSLPSDHGPHDEAQTEWWHVHAALEEPGTGEPLHVFAAFVVQRTDLDRVAGIPAWLGGNPVHAAWVKVQTGDRKWTADRVNIPDYPAARFVGEGLDLRHGGWRIAWEGDCLVLRVGAGRHRLDLKLLPDGEAVLPGEEGNVELQPGSRHLWAQLDEMKVEGRWQDGRKTRWLEGTGFYKHQWGRLYDDQLDGFEWFDMPLDEERHLVVAWLLDDGMRGVPGSMAWIADREGRRIDLPSDQLRVTPLETWRSLRSGARWPVAWTIEGAGLDLTVTAERSDQEIYAFPAAIYAGPAAVSGSFHGRELPGEAFVEQLGMHQPKARILYASHAPGGSDRSPETALATRGLTAPAAATDATSGTYWTLDERQRTFQAGRAPTVPSGQTVVTVMEGPGQGSAATEAEVDDLVEALESLPPEAWDALLEAGAH